MNNNAILVSTSSSEDDRNGEHTINYTNGDQYIGNCRFGEPDGFGEYHYHNGGTYSGFFSCGKRHGIGTFEDRKNVYKGTWRGDNKHGRFIRTSKLSSKTYRESWRKNRLIEFTEISYIVPTSLVTSKTNPKHKPKKHYISYKGYDRKCFACLVAPTNSTNDLCGHVAMCYECMSRCDRCSICRAPIGKIIKLFIS